MSRFSQALSDLKGKQKTSRGVSLYSRFVNRPGGRYLAAICFVLRMSPNQVTIVSGLCTFSGILLVAVVRPTPAGAILVAALLILGFMLDSADGQLARLSGKSAPSGEWLDHFLDCAKSVALHSAVLISFYRYFDLTSHAWLMVPLIFQLAATLTFVGGTLAALLLRGRADSGASTTPSNLRAIALLPADFGILAFAFLLMGDRDAFLSVYTVLAVAQVLILCALGVKWFGELSQIPLTNRG